jgi:mannose-6-phosphate isomerase-like protein (cupin superfamily)
MQPEAITELYRRTVAQGEKMSVARLEVAKGSSTRAHRHENEEVIILLKGCWQFHFTNGEVLLRPNQILTITPGVEHSSEVLEDVVAIDVCSPAREDWLNGADRTFMTIPISACGVSRQIRGNHV